MPRKKTEIVPIDIPRDSPQILHGLAQCFGHQYLNAFNAAEADPDKFPLLNACFFQLYVLHCLIRKEIHPKHKLPSLRNGDVKILRSAGTMYANIFRALKDGFALGLFSANYKSAYIGEPLLAWGSLLSEGMLLGSCYGVETKTEFINFLQKTNRLMGNLDDPNINPLPNKSHSHYFLQEMKLAASASDHFNKRHFRQFINERQTMTQLIRKSGGLVLDDGTIIEGRRRYKMPPSKNVPSKTLTVQSI